MAIDWNILLKRKGLDLLGWIEKSGLKNVAQVEELCDKQGIDTATVPWKEVKALLKPKRPKKVKSYGLKELPKTKTIEASTSTSDDLRPTEGTEGIVKTTRTSPNLDLAPQRVRARELLLSILAQGPAGWHQVATELSTLDVHADVLDELRGLASEGLVAQGTVGGGVGLWSLTDQGRAAFEARARDDVGRNSEEPVPEE